MEKIIKIIALLSSMGLMLWGGVSFKMARRAILPVVLGLICAYLTKCWWVFLAVGAGLQLTGMGYGEDSPLYKVFGSFIARGVWMVIVGLGTSIGLVIGGFMSPFLLIPYLLTNFLIGFILCKNKAPEWLISPMMGLGISSVVLYI